MITIKTFSVWIINFFIGIIGTMMLVSSITGNGSGITSASSSGASFKFGLDGTGFIIWLVLLIVYFWGARKLWGKTPGGLLTDKLLGKKS